MPVIDQLITDRYAIYNADCMEVLPSIPKASVGLAVYSPPFPELYQYSDDPRDMTNCTSYGESVDQYRFIVTELSRILMSGRLACVHCTDLKRGQLYQRDFPGDVIRVHEEVGMHFFCRVTIWKDPWHFARRTRMQTLMHKTVVEDSAKSRIAPADYMLVFKKAGDNPQPIIHDKGFREYAGERGMPAEIAKFEGTVDQRRNVFSHWIYRQYASPVWMDIRRKRLMPYQAAKDDPEEKHVCPLQLDAIDRCLALWSNADDTVLTPFMGVGSEVYEAVRLGRKAIGIELKESYYRQARANLKAVEERELETGFELSPDDDDDPVAADELDEVEA